MARKGSLKPVSSLNADREPREDILSDIAEIADLWLQAPVPLVLGKELVLVEESASGQYTVQLEQQSGGVTYPE